MNTAFVILWMVFFHIIDDFYIQAAWLSSGKQQSWWRKNAPDKKYEYDYSWALLMHSFSWSFMVMLPIAFVNGFVIGQEFLVMFAVNIIFHAITDDFKANKGVLNLWQDQLIHMAQIGLTAFALLK